MIIDFINNSNSENFDNYKINCIINSQTLWEFSIKMAEKIFLFGDTAITYAQKINILQRSHGIEGVITELKSDFLNQNVIFNEQEILNIYKSSRVYTIENINKYINRDYYI